MVHFHKLGECFSDKKKQAYGAYVNDFSFKWDSNLFEVHKTGNPNMSETEVIERLKTFLAEGGVYKVLNIDLKQIQEKHSQPLGKDEMYVLMDWVLSFKAEEMYFFWILI